MLERGNVPAIPYLKRVAEIDPQLAMAHAQLGLSYNTAGETELSIQSATTAYQLREKATERERFFIEAMYERNVTGNLTKAFETLQTWSRTYPRDDLALGLLGGFSGVGTGQHEAVLAASARALEFDPGFSGVGFRYSSLCGAYINLDRLPEAAETLRVGLERTTDNEGIHFCGFKLAFLNGDRAGMDAMASWANGKPAEREMTHFQALLLARAGQLQASRRLTDRAASLATEARQAERAATYQSAAAVSAALAEDLATAKRIAATVLNASRARDPQDAAALALALAGAWSSRSRSPTISRNAFPKTPRLATSTCRRFAPWLRSRRGNAAEAIELLRPSESDQMAVPSISFVAALFGRRYPDDTRGLAYLAQR